MNNNDPPISFWGPGWRDQALERLKEPWDVIVIGGGITGAGLLAVASRCGLRVLLLEMKDFASGTSSRSSKLVHGGLRYLKRLEFRLARGSVHERQWLLRHAPGLVTPLGFIYPVYRGEPVGPWLVELGLTLYTHLSREAGDYSRLEAVDIIMLAPGLMREGLLRGYGYRDAQTDDARLVWRVIHDAVLAHPQETLALNYTRVLDLLQSAGKVSGVAVRDEVSGQEMEIPARWVLNAAGIWSDVLLGRMGVPARLRPLRGSHLLFEHKRFPIYQAIAFCHPDDDRPVFAYPWQGATLVGTTDVDHTRPLHEEPTSSLDEADYLLHGIQTRFPDLHLTLLDVMSIQTGVRPVVSTGKRNPSEEPRDHAVWMDRGLLTVTGGKLTTFRQIAVDALKTAHEMDPSLPPPSDNTPIFSAPEEISEDSLKGSLRGRYGCEAERAAHAGAHASLTGTPYTLADLLWSAENEAVVHLDDLLSRRLRVSLLLPDRGNALLQTYGSLIQERLGWDKETWEAEVQRYQAMGRQPLLK